MATPSIPLEHQCKKCGETYPRTNEYWHRRRAAKDGLCFTCKECARSRSSQWRENHPNYNTMYLRRYREANRETLNEKKRMFYAENRELVLERNRDYYRQNTESVTEQKKYRRHAFPNIHRAARHRRRARIANASGTHTAADIRLQYKAQCARCWWCGCKINDSPPDYHVDHLIPLAKGGSNAANNIVLACPDCNLNKNDKLPHEWCGRLF